MCWQTAVAHPCTCAEFFGVCLVGTRSESKNGASEHQSLGSWPADQHGHAFAHLHAAPQKPGPACADLTLREHSSLAIKPVQLPWHAREQPGPHVHMHTHTNAQFRGLRHARRPRPRSKYSSRRWRAGRRAGSGWLGVCWLGVCLAGSLAGRCRLVDAGSSIEPASTGRLAGWVAGWLVARRFDVR